MEIHVRLAGVQLGPYSAKQVREYLTEGLLSTTDQAREVGSVNWISVAEILAKAGGETAAIPAAGAVETIQAEAPPEVESQAELSPEPEPAEPTPAEETRAPETPRRAPDAAPGVTHLPSRQRDAGSGRIPLPSVVEALSKKNNLMGPTAPSAPTAPSPSGRTAFSTMTTSPLANTKKVARGPIKSSATQTTPLPTKSMAPLSKAPPASGAKDGVTPHPTQTDDKKPRQSLLQSLTAKTVPMRTTAAPPLPQSGTLPVTTPLPSRPTIKVPEPVRPPSVAADIAGKLGQKVQPDPAPTKPPPPSSLPEEVETVKISLKKVKPADKAAETEPETRDAEGGEESEKEKPPARKRSLLGPVYVCAALALVAIYYVWSPYHAASLLQTALTDGDEVELDSAIDFKSVQASLKAQIEAQLNSAQNKGVTDSALTDAQEMLEKSVDLFVTSKGISRLVSKSGTFGTFTEADLAKTISFNTASKIFLDFNSPVNKQGFYGITDFAMQRDAAQLHLKLQGANWKLKQIDLRPDLMAPSSPTGTSPVLSPVVDTYMERGDTAAKKNDWTWAITDYTAALAISPHSAVAYNARGTARQSKGDLDGALKDYTEALKIDPKMALAYEGRGKVKTAKNDIDGAIADYTQAILYDPKMATAYDGRGYAKTAKDDLEGAIADFSQAIFYNPTLANAYSDRGFARQANGNLDGAIEDYTTALKLEPKTAIAYYNRGLARQSQGNFEAAIVDYDRALAFDPKIAGAYYNRGNAKNATHDLDGAIADFTQAIALNPKIALAYCNRGVARQAKGDLDGAIADYTQALTIDPKIAIAYYNRGRIKELKNDPDGAIADSSQALDLDPKNVQAYFNRGFAKLSKGNLDGAQDDLRQFCEAAPRDHDTDHARLYLWLIGKAQSAHPDPDPVLSDALENNWNASADDFASKTAAFLLGRLSESDYLASAASPDAKKDQGQHCEAWYFAGMKRLLMGDKTTAIEYFHKSVATAQTDYCEYILSQSELRTLEPAPTPANADAPPQLKMP